MTPESWTLETFNLQILAPWTDETTSYGLSDTNKRLLANLPAMLEAVEEDLTLLLPEGYSARITEWNEEDPHV